MKAQKHGGSLRVGSAPGNTPGSGRPLSAIVAAAQSIWDGGLPILADIIAGKLVSFVKPMSIRDSEGGSTIEMVRYDCEPTPKDRVAALAEVRAVAFTPKLALLGSNDGPVEFTITMGKQLTPPGADPTGSE